MLFHTEGGLSQPDTDNMEFREKEMRKNYTLSGAVLPLELPQRELPPLLLDNPHLRANRETYSSESFKVGMSSTSKINKLKVCCFFSIKLF